MFMLPDALAARGDELASGWGCLSDNGVQGNFVPIQELQLLWQGMMLSRFTDAAASALEKTPAQTAAYGRYCRGLPLRA